MGELYHITPNIKLDLMWKNGLNDGLNDGVSAFVKSYNTRLASLGGDDVKILG